MMKKSVTAKRSAAAAAALFLLLGCGADASAQLGKKDASSVMGYYRMEDCSALIVDGKIYRLTPDKGSKLIAESYEVYGDKGRQVIVTDDFTAALIEQPQKGKTETGGVSCALYTDFKGIEPEYEFQEGKETEIDAYVFDNDYMVVTREPLSNFFGVDAAGLGQTEGSGFSSPEEAVYYYIEGLKNGSLSQMLSAHAVETYVERYRLDKQIEQTGGYVSGYGSGVISNISDFSRGLNIEKRRNDIVTNIRRQYLLFTGSGVPLDVEENDYIRMADYEKNASGEDLIADIFPAEDVSVFEKVECFGILDPADLEEGYSSESTLKLYEMLIKRCGGDEIRGTAAYITIGNRHFILYFDVICYEGRWYLLNTGGYTGSYFKADVLKGGATELEKEEIAEIKSLAVPYTP